MDLLRTGLMKTQGLVATSENPTFVVRQTHQPFNPYLHPYHTSIVILIIY
jgi:hypothetical protein